MRVRRETPAVRLSHAEVTPSTSDVETPQVLYRRRNTYKEHAAQNIRKETPSLSDCTSPPGLDNLRPSARHQDLTAASSGPSREAPEESHRQGKVPWESRVRAEDFEGSRRITRRGAGFSTGDQGVRVVTRKARRRRRRRAGKRTSSYSPADSSSTVLTFAAASSTRDRLKSDRKLRNVLAKNRVWEGRGKVREN